MVRAINEALPTFYNNLANQLVDVISACDTRQCFESKIGHLQEVQKGSKNMMEFLGEQVEECIRREYSNSGLDGYNKCFIMFSHVVPW